MEYWTWEPELSVGINVIDGQHKQIILYLNELNLATQLDDRDKISDILDELMDYTTTHFAYEEELMNKASYPLSEDHKTMHNGFIEKIEALSQRHNGGENVGGALLAELKSWLFEHIKKEDACYSPYAKDFIGDNKAEPSGKTSLFGRRH